MNFKVVIQDNVRTLIRSWNLPRDASIEVYNRLWLNMPEEISSRLAEQLPPYPDSWSFAFALSDAAGVRQHFAFAVARSPGRLDVVAARHIAANEG